jgi:hypothetical protein
VSRTVLEVAYDNGDRNDARIASSSTSESHVVGWDIVMGRK